MKYKETTSIDNVKNINYTYYIQKNIEKDNPSPKSAPFQALKQKDFTNN